MAISASALTIEQLFKSGAFQPARVQRNYQWTHRECGQLLNDLEAALQAAGLDPDPSLTDVEATAESGAQTVDEEETEAPAKPLREQSSRARPKRNAPKAYYLGPMVLYRRPQAASEYYIFDGQQRFTTIAILLAALRDHDSHDNWMANMALLRDDEQKRARLRVTTPGGSLAHITNAYGGCKWRTHSANQSPADLCMYRAAQQFMEATRQWSEAKRRAFTAFLRANVHVTVTYLDDPALAHIVFETANTRGLSLSPGDILKGQIVHAIYEAHGAGRANVGAEQWERIRKRLGPRFDGYLRAVDFIAFGQSRDSDMGEDLLDEFEGPDGAARAEHLLNERLPAYVNDYAPIWAHETPSHVKYAGTDAWFKRLAFFKWREWEAVAMALHNRDAEKPDRFRRDIAKLHAACMVMHLQGWHARPKSRAFVLSKAIDQIDKGGNPFAQRACGQSGALYFFDDTKRQVRGALRAPLPDDSDVYGPVVRWLESLDWPQGLPRALFSSSSVEHVLPRKHEGAWVSAIPDDAERELCKNLLGNLCLLPASLNDDLSNGGPAEKHAGFLTTDSQLYRAAHQIAGELPKWNATTIRARTERLAQQAEAALHIA